jgi:hypothetical protein
MNHDGPLECTVQYNTCFDLTRRLPFALFACSPQDVRRSFRGVFFSPGPTVSSLALLSLS